MKKWMIVTGWLLLGWICSGNSLSAQDYPYEIDQYDFVNYEANHISWQGDSTVFDLLWQKLDRLMTEGTGQIRMMQVGGSHIQADIWSDRMRQRMQTFFPGNKGFRGFLFPYKLARTNNPWNYVSEYSGEWEGCRNVQISKSCDLGLAGMNVTTNDSGAWLKIGFRGGDYPVYDFDRLRVFHEMGATSYKVKLADTLLQAEVWVDSALGYTEFRFSEFQQQLELVFVKTDSLQNHFTLFGLSLESEEPGIVYDAIGVNGASVPSYLRCNLWEQHLRAVKPDIVVLSIGINDAYTSDFSPAAYETNYDSLVARIRRANPEAMILFTTNNDSYYKRRYANKNAFKVRETMERLAKKHNGAVWDMFEVMGGLGSIRTWERNDLAKKDKIHLTSKGYRFLADLMFNALMREYDKHIIATGGTE